MTTHEPEVAVAKEVVATHYEAFERPLHQMASKIAKILVDDPKSSLAIQYKGIPLSEDVFSNPFCNAYSGFGQPLSASIGNYRYTQGFLRANKPLSSLHRTVTYAFQTSTQEVLIHWWHLFNSVIIDPVIGQRIHLDEAIKVFPDLFVSRILVGRPQTILKNLGLEYDE